VHRAVKRQGAWLRLRLPLPLRRLRAFPHDPSNQAELRDYLHQLLAGRERLAAAVPQLADWARRDATPSDEEIEALRALIRRNDQIIDELDPAERAAVLDAIATARRVRSQLRVTIPDRFKGVTRPARPTLVPRPAGEPG
jgi:plasmid stability protein